MKKGKLDLYRTTIHEDKKGKTTVVYYETAIVTFDKGEILLNTGNWRTRSTKTRMNKVSEYFKLGYRVSQKGSQWLVEYKDEIHTFSAEQIRLNRKTGEVTPLG